MKKSNFEFCTKTWNPLDGCLNNCRYCYARLTAERFGGHRSFATYMAQDIPIDTTELRILEFPMRDEVSGQVESYPFMFSPTYHRHRLTKLPSEKRSENILVCSTGDLLGDWVDHWIIEEVFEHAMKSDCHNYLFATKNPARYDALSAKPENMLFGTTVDTQKRADTIIDAQVRSLDFLIIEPILTGIDLAGFLKKSPSRIRWVIVGAENGNSAKKVFPKREWITAIANACTARGIPLFMEPGDTNRAGKQYLKELMGSEFRQEYPLLLKKNLYT